ncbi:hypothetical protein RRG08_034914 [Elysia crispata]|uniref:Uncharacterized protein n=1 Tax=Elysia crispata TaxID=231223 RepID=A0AAE0YQ25_9GAST|nr:hypothetical protein RRG08_034914 [Elysia crispata]
MVSVWQILPLKDMYQYTLPNQRVLQVPNLNHESGNTKQNMADGITIKPGRWPQSGRLIDTSEDKYTSEDIDTPDDKDTSEDIDTPGDKDASEDIDSP